MFQEKWMEIPVFTALKDNVHFYSNSINLFFFFVLFCFVFCFCFGSFGLFLVQTIPAISAKLCNSTAKIFLNCS